ncbi:MULTISPECIES: universal stress protein [Olivibacter]|uniref:Universal stress protein n=2 Tax=Olivibacter TaxID=376469 RepID=A0ABV6HLY0_9SPHI|nr:MULTISPECIES: universal stress protein [Olivibacter]MCL4642238.1 universal stress protein [Olivibacter sp. UJ_SKK_5.1]MDM8176034.1 universal stress protein [Olivibacter sp. 47]MDX3917408.1 universal stress protein [Pseudosphingobacterium sp.]
MKILVTTDLSSNSKGGIRFALQLAEHYQYELTFFYTYHNERPTWNDLSYKGFQNTELQNERIKLIRFIRKVAGSIDLQQLQLYYHVQESLFVAQHILQYAQLHQFTFICIGRSAAGWHRKLFGSVANILIKQSHVPIIIVPPDYRRRKLRNVLYASDLTNFESELNMVLVCMETLKLKVDILHFSLPSDQLNNKVASATEIISKLPPNTVQFFQEKYNFEEPLVKHLAVQLAKFNPSILVMFTDQQRTFFEKLFLGSDTVSFSSLAKWPMLVFPKPLT